MTALLKVLDPGEKELGRRLKGRQAAQFRRLDRGHTEQCEPFQQDDAL